MRVIAICAEEQAFVDGQPELDQAAEERHAREDEGHKADCRTAPPCATA